LNIPILLFSFIRHFIINYERVIKTVGLCNLDEEFFETNNTDNVNSTSNIQNDSSIDYGLVFSNSDNISIITFHIIPKKKVITLRME
jgi:hypothetical protein